MGNGEPVFGSIPLNSTPTPIAPIILCAIRIRPAPTYLVKTKEGETYTANNAVFEAVRRNDEDYLYFANIEGGPKQTIYRINPDRKLTEIATWTYVVRYVARR